MSLQSLIISEEVKKVVSDFHAKTKREENLSIKQKLDLYNDTDDLEFKRLGPFKILIMDRRITTNTTTLRRINTFKVLIFGGNYNGVIGYGKGRGHTSSVAMKKAMENFKQNLIAINLDMLNTWPKGVYAKFGKTEMSLWSKRRFNSWGNIHLGSMIQLSGVHHCMFKINYDKPNPYNLTYCFMKLFTQNTTPKLLAEERGVKLFDTIWSRKPGAEDSLYGII
jgi:ribosomal protein S5